MPDHYGLKVGTEYKDPRNNYRYAVHSTGIYAYSDGPTDEFPNGLPLTLLKKDGKAEQAFLAQVKDGTLEELPFLGAGEDPADVTGAPDELPAPEAADETPAAEMEAPLAQAEPRVEVVSAMREEPVSMPDFASAADAAADRALASVGGEGADLDADRDEDAEQDTRMPAAVMSSSEKAMSPNMKQFGNIKRFFFSLADKYMPSDDEGEDDLQQILRRRKEKEQMKREDEET